MQCCRTTVTDQALAILLVIQLDRLEFTFALGR